LTLFGLQKTTLIDYPGLVSATIFTRGCNLRCPYCHNPELVYKENTEQLYNKEDIFDFIIKRKNVLGGICISGGEPLLCPDIRSIIDFIHTMGLKVKIDTNGTMPDLLKKLKVDYIAMDIKTVPEKYSLLVKDVKDIDYEKIKESIRWIISSGIQHEFRTTVASDIVSTSDMKTILSYVSGAERYCLNQFRPENTLDPAYMKKPSTSIDVLNEMKKLIEGTGVPCLIRYSEGRKKIKTPVSIS